MIDRRRLLVLPAAAALGACVPGLAGARQARGAFSSEGLAALHGAMDGFVDDGAVAGISTLLLHRGREVAFHAHGEQSRATGAPVARDTLFRIFSMTKPVTAVVMMQLYEEGRWGLDDPVTCFLPEMAGLKVATGRAKDGTPVLEDAIRPPTLRELLCHTGGFAYGYPGDERPASVMFRQAGVMAATDLDDLVRRVAALPLLVQPGTEWNYSISTDLLGAVIARITGRDLETVFRERVFAPLGMADTGFTLPTEKLDRLMDLYVTHPATGAAVPASALPPGLLAGLDRDYSVPPPAPSAGGGLVSSIDDYARFAQVLAGGGASRGVRLLKTETVALMGRNHIPERALGLPNPNGIPFGPGLGFGLGVMVVTDPATAGLPDGRGAMSWDGAASTWFWADPENDLVFVGMVQRIGGPVRLQLQAASRQHVYGAFSAG